MGIKRCSELSLETPGCHPGGAVFSIKFKVDAELGALLPYLNAEAENSAYFKEAGAIRFALDGKRCILSSDQIRASPFEEREQALAFVKQLLEYLNELDQRKDTLTPDHTPFQRIPAMSILRLLPKTNCGECDHPTCMAFAAALSQGETDVMRCPELANPNNENGAKLHELLGG